MTPTDPSDPLYGTQPDYRILEGIDDAILVVDDDGRIIWANTASRQIPGLHENDPEQAEKVWEITGRILAASGDDTRIREFECWLGSPERKERKYRCSGWRSPDGRDWIIRIRRSPDVEDYEAIVEYTGTATILIEENGIISMANTEFERLSGYPRDEIVGVKQLIDFVVSDDERWRLTEYHDLQRKDPLATPKSYSFSFIDRSGNIHTVEATIGLIPGTFRSVISLLDVTGRKRAKMALRENEKRLNLALSVVSDGLVDWDVSTGAVFHRPRCFTMLSYDPGTFVSTIPEVLTLVHPNDRGRVEAVLADMTAGELDRCRIELRMKSTSGEWVHVLSRLKVIWRDESGAPLRITGTHSDITGRKEAEKELLIRDMAIASSPSAFTIADLDGHLTYVNQAFLSMWGHASDAEVIGKRVTEFWQDERESIAAFRAIIETGRYTGERIGKKRDGTTFHVTFSGILVRDRDGTPLCLTASLNDITDLKLAEAEIQAHNRELSILNQIIGVSTSATDIDEALEKVLAATLTLFDLRGGSIYLIEPDRQSARLACMINFSEFFPQVPYIPDITAQPYMEVLVAGKALFLDNHPHLHHPGENDETPCPYASIPIVAHGKVIGALNVVAGKGRQFTNADRFLLTAIGKEIRTSIERILLIRQLEMAEQEANFYLDVLSHDIRNAENVSGLYTGILIDMLDGEAKSYAEKLRSSIRKSIDIVRNVSTIRRIHHESAILAPVDLDGIIRGEIEIFSGNRIHYSGTDLAVMADLLLPEIFANLIGNAAKFGGSDVEITIRVEEGDGEVEISVEDTGPGVPDEMKESIFTRFGKKNGRNSGQGLGLSITRMLITRYNGTLRVEDRVPGRPECGAAFRFTLKKV